MTLQQKMLAKQSKKGFTLVELVVVIAILAILAAIAIPAVVGIINSANESSGQTNAAAVDNACKTFYAGIKSGSINSTSSKNPDGSSVSVAASKGASDKEKISKAKAAKVSDAQKYSGLDVSYDNLCYYTANDSTAHKVKGDIVYYDGTTLPDDAKTTSLTKDTTLGGTSGLYAG